MTGWHLIAIAFSNLQVAIAVRNRSVRLRIDVAAMLKQENGQLHRTRNPRCTRLPPLNFADVRPEDKRHLFLCQAHILPGSLELFRRHDHLRILKELLDREWRHFTSLPPPFRRAFSSRQGNDYRTSWKSSISQHGMQSTGRILASRRVKLYNGPATERPFEMDYPNGHRSDAAGNLTHDIDGNPLEVGGRIAGRGRVAGTDEALSPTQFDAIAKEGTGRNTQVVPPSALGGSGTVAQVLVDRYSRLPKGIELSSKIPDADLPNVYGHETGHVIDQLAGEIPVEGLTGELGRRHDDMCLDFGGHRAVTMSRGNRRCSIVGRRFQFACVSGFDLVAQGRSLAIGDGNKVR